MTDVTCTFRTLGDLVLRAGITQGEIAHKLGFRNRVSVHRKINGQRKWYYDELVKLGAMLRAKNISVKIDTLVLLAGEGQVVIRSRTVKPGEVTDD